MAYFVSIFSPQTYEAFGQSDRTVTGFRARREAAAQRVQPGDKFVCYLTKLTRWVGILEVIDGPYRDATPIFAEEDDPFVVRFHVIASVWLPLERAVPIHDDEVWNGLSFTRGQSKTSVSWVGKIAASLVQLDAADGALLESILRRQAGDDGRLYPIDLAAYRRLAGSRVRRPDRDVTVVVPEDEDEEPPHGLVEADAAEARESIQIQALLAEIGTRMGMQIWVPRADRARVLKEWRGPDKTILDRLPLNYDDTTLKTIEQIDVLWLKGRAIKRAFEVEHTTSVYSGILRMADLLALQPNMDIRLHIVAPASRREKVFQQLRRPVFSLLDRGPLSESCTFLSYDSIRELAQQPHLAHLSDSVIEEYEEDSEP